jgi:hypothetical protein
MKDGCQFAEKVALVLMALVLPAAASSIKYLDTVTGVKNETATVSLSFNRKTDQITGTIHFAGGAFGGITEKFSGVATCKGSTCVYALNTTVNGDNLSYTVTFSDPAGSLNLISANGDIWNTKKNGTFIYSAVPEGGSKLSYLIPSGIALFAGMWFSGKQRRKASLFAE